MQKNFKILGILVLIGIGIISFGFYAENELTDITQRNEVQISVNSTIESFNGNLTSIVLTEGKYYSFVLNDKLDTFLAHPRKELVDTHPTAINHANIPVSEILERLDQDGSTWIYYKFYNPETGNVDPKSTYLVKDDKYIFGAGFYSP